MSNTPNSGDRGMNTEDAMSDTPNTYEGRRAERIDRLRARAERKRAEGEATIQKSRSMADIIPLGQPILVGHHSEGRDRRYRAKIDRGLRRGVGALTEARDLERRADAAEANRTISSDDPSAIEKLRRKLDTVERGRELAKRINAVIRMAQRKGEGWEEAARAGLSGLGLMPTTIENAVTRDELGNYGVPSFRLTNLAAEARRLRERIAVLEKEADAPPVEPLSFGAVRVEEGDNRVRIVLPGKPSDAARALLKSRGFRWSPTAGAWQRQATEAGRYAARTIAAQLAAESEETGP